jgi:NADPH:quinone reductase and related Zn-dependent oxidoreductases
MTRAIRFHETGGPDVLRFEPVEVPAPGPGDVLIRAAAFGLNRAETLFRSGSYIETPSLPSGLGLEASGVVEAVGAGVTAFSPGDAVSVVPPISMVARPVHAERFTYPADRVLRNPEGIGHVEAAATWMAYLTAYGALVDLARLRSGETVAITAASSSVGLAAIDVARRVGARPVAITRTVAKREALLAAGADAVVASAEEPVAETLARIAGPDGVRVVLDAIGGPPVGDLAAAMARHGILIAYGGLSPEPTPFPLLSALSNRLTLRGYLVHEVTEDPVRLAAAIAFVREGLASGAFTPRIAKVFPFEAYAEAHRYLESNAQFGKVVVRL